MLLVHGLGEHSARYEHVGDVLSDAGYDVLGYDQRGFGESGGRRAFVLEFDEYTDDVAALVAERRVLDVPLVLIGHSLGGLVVTRYLLSNQPQPDLAVLSAPALDADIPTWQKRALPFVSRVAPKLHMKSDFDGSVLSRDVDVQAAYNHDPLRVSGATAALGGQVLAAIDYVKAHLDRLSVPTYVLHGADDALVPATASEQVGELALVTRRVWPGLLHECLNEPEWREVLDEILAWLDAEVARLSPG